jgi:putative membrane protein
MRTAPSRGALAGEIDMKFALYLAPAMVLAAPVSAQVMAPAEYVATAGASDFYERTSSQVVLQTTKDPKIRSFAQMMIAHHTKSTADVTAAAVKSRVRPAPPRLDPLQTELVAQLRAEAGPARDAAYVAQQKASHNQALAVQQAYAAEGTAPALKAAAAAIVPVVQQHIEVLKRM